MHRRARRTRAHTLPHRPRRTLPPWNYPPILRSRASHRCTSRLPTRSRLLAKSCASSHWTTHHRLPPACSMTHRTPSRRRHHSTMPMKILLTKHRVKIFRRPQQTLRLEHHSKCSSSNAFAVLVIFRWKFIFCRTFQGQNLQSLVYQTAGSSGSHTFYLFLMIVLWFELSYTLYTSKDLWHVPFPLLDV